MRHKRKTIKLGTDAKHTRAILVNLALSLIEHGRIKTTVAKAKAVRPFVEKLVTKARSGTLHDRRLVLAKLQRKTVKVEKLVKKLFDEIAPRNATRAGGYTRILKLGQRHSDAAPMAMIEWVDSAAPVVETAQPEPAAKKTRATKTAAKPKAKAAEEGTEEKKPARKPRAKKTEEKSEE